MKRVLFLGEDSLTGAGRYLSAILHAANIPFDHLPDQKRLPAPWMKRHYAAVILSDYRGSSWTAAGQRWITQNVHDGMGLLMIGGWASFTGLFGHYKGSPIETLLPVTCAPTDDRVNHAAVLLAGKDSPIVCGYHRVIAKSGTQTLFEFQDVTMDSARVSWGKKHPALVTGSAGRGRTAAFMTDCAPHWAGSLVDWGRKRQTIRLSATCAVEVGDSYLAFFEEWIRWVGHAA